MADLGAESLFQVIAEGAEKATVIMTTNLPFSEWTPGDPQCSPLQGAAGRITDRAHIIETGADSFRFRRTVEKGRDQDHGLIDARAVLRLSLRSSPEHSASPSLYLVQQAATDGPELTATGGPRLLAKLNPMGDTSRPRSYATPTFAAIVRAISSIRARATAA